MGLHTCPSPNFDILLLHPQLFLESYIDRNIHRWWVFYLDKRDWIIVLKNTRLPPRIAVQYRYLTCKFCFGIIIKFAYINSWTIPAFLHGTRYFCTDFLCPNSKKSTASFSVYSISCYHPPLQLWNDYGPQGDKGIYAHNQQFPLYMPLTIEHQTNFAHQRNDPLWKKVSNYRPAKEYAPNQCTFE